MLFGLDFVIALSDASNGFLLWTFRISAMAYFCLGACLRQHPIRIQHFPVICTMALISSLMLDATFRAFWLEFLFVPLFMLGLWILMPIKPLLKYLEFTAFTIYLIHPFVIKLWGSVLGRSCLEAWWLLMAQDLTSIGISVAVVMLFKIRFRHSGSILFGGSV